MRPCPVCGRSLLALYYIQRDTEPGRLTLDEETHIVPGYYYCDNCGSVTNYALG